MVSDLGIEVAQISLSLNFWDERRLLTLLQNRFDVNIGKPGVTQDIVDVFDLPEAFFSILDQHLKIELENFLTFEIKSRASRETSIPCLSF